MVTKRSFFMLMLALILAVFLSGCAGEKSAKKSAPDFTLITTANEAVTLSDFKGKKVILVMWASWCPSCIEELPELEAFYRDHKEEVEILAINMTESEADVSNVTRFMEELELTFPVLLDEKSEVADLYEITTIPATFILNKNGAVEFNEVGFVSYDMLREAIKDMK